MNRIWLFILSLAAATIACNLGSPPLIPTIPPTFGALPTATPLFQITTPTATFGVIPVIGATQANVIPTFPSIGGPINTNPQGCAYPAGWLRYIVQPGDSLGVIASIIGADLNTLAAANCVDNPDFLAVGATLYLPRLPVTQAVSTATAASPVAARFTLSATPASVISGQYVVTGRITVIADGVQAGTRVVFYYSYPGSGMFKLGESQITFGRASYAFETVGIQSGIVWYITAVSQNPNGGIVQYADQILLTRDNPVALPTATAPNPATQTGGPIVGMLSLSPAQLAPLPDGRYEVKAGKVTVGLSSIEGATRVRFLLFPAPNAEPITVGDVTTPPPSGPVYSLWIIDCSKATGRLIAQAESASGAVTLSAGLDIFCVP